MRWVRTAAGHPFMVLAISRMTWSKTIQPRALVSSESLDVGLASVMLQANAAHQWRAANGAYFETDAQSARPLNAPGSALHS